MLCLFPYCVELFDDNFLNNKTCITLLLDINKENDAFSIAEPSIPRSKLIFKPEKIESITDNIITLLVRESMTNGFMRMRITTEMFDIMCSAHPEKTKFLMENYKKQELGR